MTNVTDSPREVALAAAKRLKLVISQCKHDIYLQQAMRTAHLVVAQSGILTGDDNHRDKRPKHFLGSLTIH